MVDKTLSNSNSRETNENGKGLATAGLICCVVGVITQLFGVLGLILFNAQSVPY